MEKQGGYALFKNTRKNLTHSFTLIRWTEHLFNYHCIKEDHINLITISARKENNIYIEINKNQNAFWTTIMERINMHFRRQLWRLVN